MLVDLAALARVVIHFEEYIHLEEEYTQFEHQARAVHAPRDATRERASIVRCLVLLRKLTRLVPPVPFSDSSLLFDEPLSVPGTGLP